MERQTRRTIEEKLKVAEQEVARAQAELTRCQQIKKKKENLQSKFKYLIMGKTDLEIRMENNPERYGVTTYGGLGMGHVLPLAKQNPALDALYEFKNDCEKRFFQGREDYLHEKIRASINKYIDKIWNRTITEQEYDSIIAATEPFLGRYIQRVYDVRRQRTEELQNRIEEEERAYAREHKRPTTSKTQDETKIEQTALPQKRGSLFKRLFRGQK